MQSDGRSRQQGQIFSESAEIANYAYLDETSYYRLSQKCLSVNFENQGAHGSP